MLRAVRVRCDWWIRFLGGRQCSFRSSTRCATCKRVLCTQHQGVHARLTGHAWSEPIA
jgi:hypothetical protein